MNKWGWVLYPILVAVFVIYTGVTVLSNVDTWAQITQKREDVQVQQEKAALLRNKLVVLSNFDTNKAQIDLHEMLDTLPDARLAWSLISEIKNAAAQSEVELKEYKSNAGNVKQATAGAVLADESGVVLTISARVPDIVRLRRFLNVLMTQKPLVRLLRLSFSGGAMQLTVEGGWSRMVHETPKNTPLQEYGTTIAGVRSQMEKYVLVSVEQAASGSGNFGVTNPF